MGRITIKNLTALLGVMMRELGTPEGPAYTRKDGRNVAAVGKLLVQPGSSTYGNAWALCQIMNEQGGERDILRARSARELFSLMHAYRDGYQAAKRGEV